VVSARPPATTAAARDGVSFRNAAPPEVVADWVRMQLIHNAPRVQYAERWFIG
jgi:hypothetical protein